MSSAKTFRAHRGSELHPKIPDFRKDFFKNPLHQQKKRQPFYLPNIFISLIKL